MEALPDSFRPEALKVTTPGQQFTRQRISNNWTPHGFERWQYMNALLKEMPVVGGPDDSFMDPPARYRPASPCMETLDCHCGE